MFDVVLETLVIIIVRFLNNSNKKKINLKFFKQNF